MKNASNDNKSLWHEKIWAWAFAITILGIIAVTYVISEAHELPMTIIGAVLGVAMTVFATYFLFQGQSKQQEAMMRKQSELQMSMIQKQSELQSEMMHRQSEIQKAMMREQHDIEGIQEKESEIFKQKMASYTRFLDALRNYVTEPTEPHKKEVIFHAMALRIHTNADISNDLDSNIIKLIKDTGTDAEVKTLVESLNAIACIFGKELYGESAESTTNVGAFVAAISGSQEEPTEDEKLKDAAEEEKEDAKALQDSKLTGWADKIKSLKTQGWNLTEGDDSLTLSSDSTPVVISIYRKKGKYIVEATKEDDSDFSKALKNSFKGSRRYGTWWRELPINNYGVTEGSLLAQLPINDRARASVIKWIDKLLNVIE